MTEQGSLLSGPEKPPQASGDLFDELAAIAVERALRPGASLYGADYDRMRIEVARMLRKAFVYGQSGVHPSEQTASGYEVQQ